MKTKYGNAGINKKDGHYQIKSRKEGNHGKYLHRLVFEDYHNCKLDKNDVIHHIDNDPLNNHPTNLICMSKKAHAILHRSGAIHSDETKQKISEAIKGKPCESRNTTGYYNVVKHKSNTCKQGYYWKYQYYEDGKQKAISSVSLEKLEQKVKNKGLIWKKLKGDDI